MADIPEYIEEASWSHQFHVEDVSYSYFYWILQQTDRSM